MPYRIVIDTNLLIDGSTDDYNFGNRIVDEVIAGKIEACANKKSLRENIFISRQKISDQDYLEKLEQYFHSVIEVDPLNIDIVEDQEDNKILASAITGNASHLITSDWHLLKIGEYEGVKVVRPAEFWQIYSEESGDGWRNWMSNFIK